jgi:hypothetical protein
MEATRVRFESLASLPGTNGSNPVPSSGESTNFQFLNGNTRSAARGICIRKTRSQFCRAIALPLEAVSHLRQIKVFALIRSDL